MAEQQVRVMLVDDHEVVRMGIRMLLERRPGFVVVAEAGSVQEAVSQARQSQPDVIVMDIRLPDATVVSDNPTINGPAETTYVIDGLDPGTYTFICSVHPIPGMTGILTVK